MGTGPARGHPTRTRWPRGAQAAITLTMDNMGEAADLNRKLWPESKPIGEHFSVTRVLPALLHLLKKYDISATYFIESWNINVYGTFILDQIAHAGHEVAWHAWQHEAWAKLTEAEERANFERSFGADGIGPWLADGRIEPYRGFRPPGGIVHGERTLKLCREYGLGYLSPAAEEAATIEAGPQGDKLVILPFKWATVDAYFYMETFSGLRKLKGEYPSAPQPPDVLVKRYTSEIDRAIETGGYLALLFHPFLTDRPERVDAMESVLAHLARKRDEGKVWLARCREVEGYIREHPGSVGSDPQWDLSAWR